MSSTILNTSRFFLKSRPVKNLLIQRSFNSCTTQFRDFNQPSKSTGRAPLEGVRVLDLTRVLGTTFITKT